MGTILFECLNMERDKTMKWIKIKDKTPKRSGIYDVKLTGIFSYIKQAYYDVASNHWDYDDGCWLPIGVDAYITHWKEVEQ